MLGLLSKTLRRHRPVAQRATQRAVMEMLEERRMLSVTSYVYDWDDPVHGSTDGWDPASTYGGHLGKFTNETVTLTVDDWAPHVGLTLSSGTGLNAWGNNTVHEVKVYVGEEAVYRYFTYRLNPQTLIYDEEPLGDYATLGYIPHTDSQVQLRFEGSGFDQQDQYDYWKVMQYSIHAVMPTLQSLTVTNQDWGDEAVTVSTTSSGSLDLAINGDFESVVNLSAAVTPSTAAAYQMMLYTVSDAMGSVVASGALSQASIPITLEGDSLVDTAYTFRAGFDANGNGVLDGSEVTRTVNATNKKVVYKLTSSDPGYDPQTTTLTIARPGAGQPAKTVDLKYVAYSNGKIVKGDPPRPDASWVHPPRPNETTPSAKTHNFVQNDGKWTLRIGVSNQVTQGTHVLRLTDIDGNYIDLTIVIQ